MRRLTLLAAAALALFTPAARAGFIGANLGAGYDYPDLATPYAFASFTAPSFIVGAGAETIGDIEGVTTLTVDFTDSKLTILLATTLHSPTFGDTPFNGPVFTLLTPGSLGIVGATVDPAATLAG